MRKKRILVRTLTRALYVGGIVFLVSGMLISAISSPVLAAETSSPADPGNNIASFLFQQETPAPACVECKTPNPTELVTATRAPGGDAGSSLIFASTCDCGCDFVRATVCNVGDAAMLEEVEWRLYFSANGNPQLGSVVDKGSLGPLESGQCFTLDNGPKQGGNYMYRVFQEEGYTGPGSLWSSSCIVSGDCFPGPTKTSTPGKTGTPTATKPALTRTFTATAPFIEETVTVTPTRTAERTQTRTAEVRPSQTRTPMPFNLSFICGYASDDFLLWRVYNQTDEDIDYVWRVSGSDEDGSGTVEANGTDYFMTSLGDKTVRVFVDDELVDSETSGAFCKLELEISHTCSASGEGIDWYVRNPNDFAVNIEWDLDGEDSGSGSLEANSRELVTTSELGEHTLTVNWTDTRPGEHVVQQTSDIDSCEAPTRTLTPTFTSTAPFIEETITPTRTATTQIEMVTLTPTSTNTRPAPTRTFTSTPTNTQPVSTATVTSTPTNTQPGPTRTFTSTPTNTQPVSTVTVTATPTNTQPVSTVTVTATPTNTQPGPTRTLTSTPTTTVTPPFVIVTFTPTFTGTPTITPSPSVTQTQTITALPSVTSTPTGTATAPFVIVTFTPTFTNTPTNTQQPTLTWTPTITNTLPAPPLIEATVTPTVTVTSTATQIVTLAPPAATSTPPIIPVTGEDMLAPLMATNLMGNLFTNIGLFMLGLALALTGFTSQWKE